MKVTAVKTRIVGVGSMDITGLLAESWTGFPKGQ